MPRLPFPQAMNWLIQTGEGLEHAHQQGIVHQDIKPGNIFVREGDRVKIVDFGLACRRWDGRRPGPGRNTVLHGTRTDRW